MRPTKMPTHGMPRGNDGGADLSIALLFFTLAAMVALFWWSAGCGTPCPQVKATRCSGSVVELCGSNKKWQFCMSCDKVVPVRAGAPAKWRCVEGSQGASCVPSK